MSYSKLIHEYLDGQTNMVNEDILFAELAKNSDLRIEFNQQVQIQNVAMTDMRTISPPAESTNAVFSALGFTIPSKEYLNRISAKPADALRLSKTAGSTFANFWKKHAVTVAAIFLTAGLTTSVFMLTDDRFAPADIPVLSELIQKDIPTVSSQGEKSENNLAVTPSANFAPNNHRSNTPSSPTVPVETETISASIAKTDINNLNSSQNIDINSAFRNEFSANMINSQMVDPIAELFNLKPARNFNEGNLALLVSYQNTTPTNIDINNNLMNNIETNINITALYKVGENWYVGATFGKENFAMNFNRDLNGEQLNYQQNPTLWYYGATARYSANLDNLVGFSISQFAKPYTQIFAGSTNMLGFMGSGQIGLTLTPYNNFAMNFGYEFKTYIYSVDQNIELTNKNGFIFGAGLSF